MNFSLQTIEIITNKWKNKFGIYVKSDISDDKDLSNEHNLDYIKQYLKKCVYNEGGDVNARNNAIILGNIYSNLSYAGKLKFLHILNNYSIVDEEETEKLFEDYKNSDLEKKDTIRIKLKDSLSSESYKLLKKFSSLSDGIFFLVKMREDILNFLYKYPELKNLENDLCVILGAWFDIGLLSLTRITWDSSASLLSRLIAYEAVHKINSWEELKNRLEENRLCYAFLHPHIPNEPIIFIEVAIENTIPDNIKNVLNYKKIKDNTEEKNLDTVVFYSISNAQKGLKGISFGNFLIKEVVKDIQTSYPSVKHFVTLSPMPGFFKWLDKKLNDMIDFNTISDSKDLSVTAYDNASLSLIDSKIHKRVKKMGISFNFKELVKKFQNDPESLDPGHLDIFQSIIMSLAAHYLIKEQKNGKRLLDPVAHFHVNNGATVYRINWLADTSVNGMKNALGLMINYYYALDKINDNYENYNESGLVTYSKHVKKLLD